MRKDEKLEIAEHAIRGAVLVTTLSVARKTASATLAGTLVGGGGVTFPFLFGAAIAGAVLGGTCAFFMIRMRHRAIAKDFDLPSRSFARDGFRGRRHRMLAVPAGVRAAGTRQASRATWK